jgi:hypothetical protein
MVCDLPSHEDIKYDVNSLNRCKMKRFLSFALAAATILAGATVRACEKHLSGHQNSSDTNAEVTRK